MQQDSPLLLPVLRSRFQGELLAWLFLHPEEEYSATELAHRFGVSQSTVSREADRFSDAGLIVTRRRGNLRLLQADTETVIAPVLGQLLALTFGPSAVLTELLESVSGVDEALIYGSWAARYHNEPGAVPRDIDVLVVGAADEDDLHDVARAAEEKLGREVNIHRVSAAGWKAHEGDPFLSSVRSGPLVDLDLKGARKWSGSKAKRSSTD